MLDSARSSRRQAVPLIQMVCLTGVERSGRPVSSLTLAPHRSGRAGSVVGLRALAGGGMSNLRPSIGPPLPAIVTDRLPSYRAAMKVIGNEGCQETRRWLNNRAGRKLTSRNGGIAGLRLSS